jgi:hypothetical protein
MFKVLLSESNQKSIDNGFKTLDISIQDFISTFAQQISTEVI